jgi:hypothetical protein
MIVASWLVLRLFMARLDLLRKTSIIVTLVIILDRAESLEARNGGQPSRGSGRRRAEQFRPRPTAVYPASTDALVTRKSGVHFAVELLDEAAEIHHQVYRIIDGGC